MATMESELVVSSSGGTVREAAIAAAKQCGEDQIDEQASMIAEAWGEKVEKLTAEYEAEMQEEGVAEAVAGPTTRVRGHRPYMWWNIVVAGPFQRARRNGPFLPAKIFQNSEPAFIVGGIWMNRNPINWAPTGPSAASIMAAFNMRIRFETMNLTTVTDGPDPAPVDMNPIHAAPGRSYFKTFYRQIGRGHFPAPPNGHPNLYELNVTADITETAPQEFAGFSTWVYDPDLEPPFYAPPFGRFGLRVPGGRRPAVHPGWQYDVPMRFMVYTA
ncbi:MAG: hypothetical protein R2911_15160 [Caldilineaceae bacterium]